MRIQSLSISNFRAIKSITLEDLPDTVLIAGPNGCGKSCILHAIRLLKSIYGGYAQNEFHSWFGEFNIAFNQKPEDLKKLLQDQTRSLQIQAVIAFGNSELDYLRSNAQHLLKHYIWQQEMPDMYTWRSFGFAAASPHHRALEPQVDAKVEIKMPEFMALLDEGGVARAECTIDPDGNLRYLPSLLLEVAYSNFTPEHLGIIDYHGPDRNYQRENVGGINLNLETEENRLRQHALYGYLNKYANVKTEMASAFVRRLIAKEADAEVPQSDIIDALQELFKTFFPGKTFLGPKATTGGSLEFPVLLESGIQHDIDDLSSGEKEVLYGYLRLRSAAPQNSVILLDEPELHLNPRLIKGLAGFYARYLAQALSNQMWLVTHSDTLLRDAVENEQLTVYHMELAHLVKEGENQLHPVSAQKEADRAIIDLVGDLASYRPGQRVVIFEGKSENSFDAQMTAKLFPEFADRANLVGGGNKLAVRRTHETLEESARASGVSLRIYSIVDRDLDPEVLTGPRSFSWDVYHIENYLLLPELLAHVCEELLEGTWTSERVESMLRASASECVNQVVMMQLMAWVNAALMEACTIRPNMVTADPVGEALRVTEAVLRKTADSGANEFTREQVAHRAMEIEERLRADLTSGEWIRSFPGREILTRFVGKAVPGLQYEHFRNLVLAKMRTKEVRPVGMANVVSAILSTD